MIRLAVRCRPELAERVLAELLELVPGGVEEERGDELGRVRDLRTARRVPRCPTSRPRRATGWSRSARPRSPTTGRTAGATSTTRSRSATAGSWCGRLGSPSLGGARAPPEAKPRRWRALMSSIDPGQAFGTGAHARPRSAWSCCSSSLTPAEAGGPLADLGTGSGVLAIAAAKLGWAPVSGCDSEVGSDRGGGGERGGERGQAGARAAESARAAAAAGADRGREPDRAAAARSSPTGSRPRRRVMVCSGLLATEVDRVTRGAGAAGLTVEAAPPRRRLGRAAMPKAGFRPACRVSLRLWRPSPSPSTTSSSGFTSAPS